MKFEDLSFSVVVGSVLRDLALIRRSKAQWGETPSSFTLGHKFAGRVHAGCQAARRKVVRVMSESTASSVVSERTFG